MKFLATGSIKATVKEVGLARNTVRKIVSGFSSPIVTRVSAI